MSDAIDKTELGKAFLQIPNDAMKNFNAKVLFHTFFNLCFLSGKNPQEWSLSNIIPIPKPEKDVRDPLNNRCITILSCVAKIYSNILNKRIQKYLDNNNILVEEQNGFRACRSCIDHVFVIISILRNRRAMGKDTFLTL